MAKRICNATPTDLEATPVLFPKAAGIDIGASSHFVALPPHIKTDTVKEFPSHSLGLNLMANFLLDNKVDTVAMEATGVYWIPVYNELESAGLEVYLVNPRELKHVPGRKSDVLDSQWIQKIFSLGLLTPSFIPSQDIVVLRGYARLRTRLIQDSSRALNHMDKALRLMNIQLDEAVSSLSSQTSIQIIKAIIDGERDALVLSQLRDKRCANSVDQMVPYLQGVYSELHLYELKNAFNQYNFHLEQIMDVTEMILNKLYEIGCDTINPQNPFKPEENEDTTIIGALKHNFPVDLTKIEGIGPECALTIYSEFGSDLSRFPTAKHFCSYLGLCPAANISGGKVLSRKTKKVVNRASTAFRLAAQSLWRSKSWLGMTFRKLKSQKGPQKAITAMAHKLARIVYTLMTKGEAYTAKKLEEHSEKVKARTLRSLNFKAAALGYELVSISIPAPEASEGLPVADIEVKATEKVAPKAEKRTKVSVKHKKTGNIISPEVVIAQLVQKGIINQPA